MYWISTDHPSHPSNGITIAEVTSPHTNMAEIVPAKLASQKRLLCAWKMAAEAALKMQKIETGMTVCAIKHSLTTELSHSNASAEALGWASIIVDVDYLVITVNLLHHKRTQ